MFDLVFGNIIHILKYSCRAKYVKQNKSVPNYICRGGDINKRFVQYVADLTQKSLPKICYLPTASADNADNIKNWESICKSLAIDPYILKVWVNSKTDTVSFEEILLNMDAIVVGGGNTLNMMGIWEAQGIDKIMQKALRKV